MPRGKHYVNQNKYVDVEDSCAIYLMISLLTDSLLTEACGSKHLHGRQCKSKNANTVLLVLVRKGEDDYRRGVRLNKVPSVIPLTGKDCIYRHTASKEPKSNEPCMAYLAGICSFSGKACRKRHPSDDECEKLLQKYALRPCRFGEQCHTEGCLYNHDPKPVVVHRTTTTTPAIPTMRQAMPGPTLSTWMPTNTLPSTVNHGQAARAGAASSSSSSSHQLRPNAGSWQPSAPSSTVAYSTTNRPAQTTGTYGYGPPIPPNPYQAQYPPAAQGGPQSNPPMAYGQPAATYQQPQSAFTSSYTTTMGNSSPWAPLHASGNNGPSKNAPPCWPTSDSVSGDQEE